MISFRIRDRDNPLYSVRVPIAGEFPSKLVTRKGTKYVIGGKEVELFPIGVLAEAIDRTPKTIVGWQREKKFPPPMFKLPGREQVRLYSAEQITNLHRLAFGRFQFRK